MSTLQIPSLILVSGPPGCGKSTLSKALAQQRRLVILDKDCIDEPFSPNDRGAHYTQEIEPKVLQALLNLAKLNLSIGSDVILDVPWTHILINSPEWIEKIQSLVLSTHTSLVVLELILSEKELKERLQQRGLKRDQIRLTQMGWEQFKKTDCVGQLNPLKHTILQANQSIEELTAQALKILNEGG